MIVELPEEALEEVPNFRWVAPPMMLMLEATMKNREEEDFQNG